MPFERQDRAVQTEPSETTPHALWVRGGPRARVELSRYIARYIAAHSPRCRYIARRPPNIATSALPLHSPPAPQQLLPHYVLHEVHALGHRGHVGGAQPVPRALLAAVMEAWE